MGNPYILFVETQGEVLRNLPSGQTQCKEDWQMIHVTDSEVALDTLSNRNISVVVANFGTDQDGCERFFREVHGQGSAAIRLGLLPEHYKDKVETSLNYADQCIALQCGPAQIAMAIQRGLSVWNRTQNKPELETLLAKIHKLPTPPALYFDLREQLECSTGNSRATARIVERDAALTAKILKVANSGFYALPRSVSDLYHAITILGTDMILGLVLSVQLFDRLPLPGLNLDTLWKHGIAVAAVARHIASEQGGDRHAVNASGVAGILHDLGALVLLANFPSEYQSMIRRAAGDEMILLDLEREHFGVDHPELGAVVLELWNLPDAVVEAVALHHDYRRETGQVLALPSMAVLLAEWLVNEYVLRGGAASGADGLECPLDSKQNQTEKRWKACQKLVEQILT